jgi:hypothetical protein
MSDALAKFKERIFSEPLDKIVNSQMFGGEAYVFREDPDAMRVLREHIGSGLKIEAEAITVVGSAKLGFSASPDTFARSFNRDSDIDVVVVSPVLFDSIWHALLEWSLPHRGHKILYSDLQWRSGRMLEIYWGWLIPDEISFDRIPYKILEPLRTLKAAWFRTFRSLSRYSQFSQWEVNGRLYRTWEHATLYHVDGLRRVQSILKGK